MTKTAADPFTGVIAGCVAAFARAARLTKVTLSGNDSTMALSLASKLGLTSLSDEEGFEIRSDQGLVLAWHLAGTSSKALLYVPPSLASLSVELYGELRSIEPYQMIARITYTEGAAHLFLSDGPENEPIRARLATDMARVLRPMSSLMQAVMQMKYEGRAGRFRDDIVAAFLRP